jgi:hypothetical protein
LTNAGCVVLACIAATGTGGNDNVPAVRTEHPVLRDALQAGCRSSSTFQDLGRRVARANGVVLVNDGSCGAKRGCLQHWIAVAGVRRYLRVLINTNKPRNEVVATIAHELQHAVEVLDDPSIRTAAAIYWRSRGPFAASQRSFETQAAIEIESAVRRELSGPPMRHTPRECAEVFTIGSSQ